MASRRTKKTRERGARPLRVLLTIGGLAAAGIIATLAISGLFERGFNEVTLPLRHEDIIRQQSRDKQVDPALIAAVIYKESRFRDQTSSAGARGLMQITHETADYIEKLSGGTEFEYSDLADPDLNIRYGTFYLSYLLDLYDDDLVAALAAYNAGPGNADLWGGSEMTIDDIEFPETRAYVKGVIEKQREYRHTYEAELGY